MMETISLVLDMGGWLRHLMMGEILYSRMWDRNDWFLGMYLAVLLLSVETETGVFRNV